MSAIKKEQNKFEWKSSKTYGKISKYALKDNVLSCDAKASYALLCTYGASNGIITAKMETLCKDLNISSKKWYNLLFELTSQGYIEIIKVKAKGNFKKNQYKLTVCPDKYFNMIPEDAKDVYALERIKERGIQSYGYGLAEQRILKDRELHIKAKGVYSYFCAFSGNTSTAYPSVEAVLRDLKICESTYYKYISQLVEKKYIQVIEHKTQDGRYSPNEYKLLGHPNSHKPSNYEKNITAVNKNIHERKPAKTNAPSPKSGTRSDKKKEPDIKINSSDPYPKNGTRQKNKKGAETIVNTSDSQSFTAQSSETENTAEPSVIPPSTTAPYPKNDRAYNENNVNNNSQNKNTHNQGRQKKLEKNLSSEGINQSKSTSKKSDSIDEPVRETFSVNSDKVYQDLLNHKGIPMSYLKNKPVIEYIIKTASKNADSSATPMSEALKAILRKSKVPFSEDNPADKPIRRLAVKCLTDMLHDGCRSAFRKHSPEEIAGFVNSHLKISNGVISFDKWLEEFENSFTQSAGKPEVGGKINNLYGYVKMSVWNFLANYKDTHFDLKTGCEPKQSSFNYDHFQNKMFRNKQRLLD